MTTIKHRGVLIFLLLFVALAGYGGANIGRAKAPVTDELYTYYQFKDQSIGALFEGLHTGVNRHPWVYFVYLWTLDQFVDMDMEACRLANLPFLIAACSILILVMARRLSPLAALTGAAAVFCLPWIVPNHLCQARSETMLLAAASVQLALFLKVQAIAVPSRRTLVLIGTISYLMPAIHYFGGIYSLFTLVALLLLDLRARCARWSLYTSFACGWLLFFATCGNTLIDQFALGSRLEDWRVQPALGDLTAFFSTILPAIPVIILMVVLIPFAPSGISKNNTKRILPLLTLGLVWLLPPMVFWVMGRAGIYLYAAKYFYPSLLGAGLLLGCMVQLALGGTTHMANAVETRAQRTLIGVFLAFCLVTQLYQAKKLTFSESRGNNFHRVLGAGEIWQDTNDTIVTSMDSVYLVNLYNAEQQKKECAFRQFFDREETRDAYLRFSPKIQTFTPAELSKVDSFVFVTPYPDLGKWRKQFAELGFRVHRSAPYNQYLFHAWQLKR